MAIARNGENPLLKRIPIKDGSGRIVGHKEVVAYRGLLDLVHRERVSLIVTKLDQAPSDSNGQTAIVLARVKTSRGTFTGIGDANPRNVNPKIVPHLVRMAETRAEARAMRKAVNIGVVAIEELDDLPDDVTLEGTMQPVERDAADAPSPQRATRDEPTNDGEGGDAASGAMAPPQVSRPSFGSSRASEQQRRFLYRILAERGVTGDKARELKE